MAHRSQRLRNSNLPRSSTASRGTGEYTGSATERPRCEYRLVRHGKLLFNGQSIQESVYFAWKLCVSGNAGGLRVLRRGRCRRDGSSGGAVPALNASRVPISRCSSCRKHRCHLLSLVFRRDATRIPLSPRKTRHTAAGPVRLADTVPDAPLRPRLLPRNEIHCTVHPAPSLLCRAFCVCRVVC